ncbi:MAG: hypothetical protein OQK82_08500 [Candidatus Pacearchaeota archaeon]|nr:hypothetical protein [Candidatus Pacearchaeota archaeon]
MDIKKISFWLFVVGVISLVIGLVIAGISFDVSKLPVRIPVFR